MTLPMPEGLRTVRFDGPRAYAITYNQTDPMFVIDLSDPAAPRQLGALYMPGFMYYLEPHGDRVIGLGIDRTDPNGSLNVSLFDVSNGSAPKMLARVAFATADITEDYLILNGEVSEDQDRIQKAFRVFSDGLVVVPFSTPLPYYQLGSSCANAGGGVQLVSWQNDTLTKHALLPLPGNPRRAFEDGTQILTVSDSNVRAFALADLGAAHQTADVTIGTCTTPSEPTVTGGNNGGYNNGYNAGSESGPLPLACAAAGARAPNGWGIALALLGGLTAWSRRRRGGRTVLARAAGRSSTRPTPRA
jgi:MYXO-CTERM domain-containing protein